MGSGTERTEEEQKEVDFISCALRYSGLARAHATKPPRLRRGQIVREIEKFARISRKIRISVSGISYDWNPLAFSRWPGWIG